MTPGISEIFEKASKIKKKEERIKFLQENNQPAIQMLLKCAFDPRVKFLLPEGEPPYKKSDYVDGQSVLWSSVNKLYLFIDGMSPPNLTKTRREILYIQFLESLDPKDAALVSSIKDKKFPYKGINQEIVEAAFPGLTK